jgi:hypothetical protein
VVEELMGASEKAAIARLQAQVNALSAGTIDLSGYATTAELTTVQTALSALTGVVGSAGLAVDYDQSGGTLATPAGLSTQITTYSSPTDPYALSVAQKWDLWLITST